MGNILDIYARASRRLPLTPAERALLKTLDQLLLSALAGAGVAIVQAALAGQQPLTFAGLAQIAAYAGATALLTGLTKLFRANGDALSQGIANALDQAGARMPAPRGFPPSVNGVPTGYRGVPSRPVNPASGSFPPLMPEDPQRRAQLLRQAGISQAGDSQPYGAVTKPTAAVSPADAAATAAQSAQTISDGAATPQATPAPSQRESDSSPSQPAQDEATGDGPPTLQMAAVRKSAAPAPAATDVPAAPAPASQWLT